MTRTEVKRVLAKAKAERARMRRRHDREREQLIAVQRRELAEVDRRLDEVTKEARRFGLVRVPVRSAAVQAGPKALGIVREMLADGAMTQAEIRHETDLNVGTVSYALRALLEAGEIAETQWVINGSRQFRLTKEGRRVLRHAA